MKKKIEKEIDELVEELTATDECNCEKCCCKEDAADYGYYSRVLDKVFDTVEDLKKAEQDHLAAEIEKKAKEAKELEVKNSRKDEAEKVKLAIEARIKAENDAKLTKTAAYKDFLAKCDDADKLIRDAKQAEKELLEEFCNKFGAFHDTITIGDITYDYSYDVNRVDPFLKLFNNFWLF